MGCASAFGSTNRAGDGSEWIYSETGAGADSQANAYGNKLNYADVVIDNSRSPEDTKRQVREALMQIPGFVFPGGCND